MDIHIQDIYFGKQNTIQTTGDAEVELHAFLISVLREGMYSQSAALMNCFIHIKSLVPDGEEARLVSRDGVNVREGERDPYLANPPLPHPKIKLLILQKADSNVTNCN